MDLSLSAEHLAIRQVAADFVAREITPHARDWDRAETVERGIVSVSLGLVAKSIAGYGSEEQKQQWLPRLTAGTALGCFALTEPGTGNLVTKAVRAGDDWVISGTKVASGAPRSSRPSNIPRSEHNSVSRSPVISWCSS